MTASMSSEVQNTHGWTNGQSKSKSICSVVTKMKIIKKIRLSCFYPKRNSKVNWGTIRSLNFTNNSVSKPICKHKDRHIAVPSGYETSI